MKVNRGKYTQIEHGKQSKYQNSISKVNDANTNQHLKTRSISRTQNNSHTREAISQLQVETNSGSSLRKRSQRVELVEETEKIEKQLENIQVKNLDSKSPVESTNDKDLPQEPVRKKKKKTIVRKMRPSVNEKLPNTLLSASKGNSN